MAMSLGRGMIEDVVDGNTVLGAPHSLNLARIVRGISHAWGRGGRE